MRVTHRIHPRLPETTMHHEELDFVEGWREIARTEHAAGATMVLAPGTSEGGPNNLHPANDQWIYVVAGEGAAIVQDEKHVLRPGVLLLVERGETHEIRNTGSVPLQTLSVYVPPLTGE